MRRTEVATISSSAMARAVCAGALIVTVSFVAIATLQILMTMRITGRAI